MKIVKLGWTPGAAPRDTVSVRPGRRGVRRLTRPVAALSLAALTLGVGACRSVGGSGRGPAAPTDVEPAIESGPSTPASDQAAAGLIRSAETALAQGDAAAAADAAGQVVERYPTARTSSLALPLLAEAELALEAWEEAARAGERYASLFAADDPRAVRGAILASRALRGQGDRRAAVERLLRIPSGTPPDPDAVQLMRELAAELDNESLAELVAATPSRALAAPLMAEQAMALWFQGQTDEARTLAGAVTELGVGGPEAETARAILEDRVESVAGALPVLGAMLAETGSPGLTEFSSGIREGIDVALALYGESSRRPVRLEVMDDQGSAVSADAVVQRLEAEGAVGVVGPLLADALARASAARTRETALISPTARRLPEGQAGVYSLAGPDDGAAEALASYASSQGLARIVVLRPAVSGPIREAQAFQRALEDLGLQLVREVAYDSGATFFQQQLEEVASLMPDALVLPLPPADVELLAPQITFYGLDTLGIQVMGTGGWTSESVISNVDPRHTTGVVATATTIPGQPAPGETRFVDAYEAHFRRTLRSPVPALGYDAAALMLQAVQLTGARTGEDLIRGLDQIADFQGATGILSVRDGRIIRRHRLVRFEDGALVPLDGVAN